MSEQQNTLQRDDTEEPKRFHFYAGKGETLSERQVKLELPAYEKFMGMDAPSGYEAPEGLAEAVNVALALGMPLLVTGEPGTGKTQLAYSVAYELELNGPLAFSAKSTSTFRDLFYQYDALRHFHDAQYLKEQELPEVEDYIRYEALGEAIILSMPVEERRSPELPKLPPRLLDAEPMRSVVLIDEIDKAPRDLPNDILNEIEHMTFEVPEACRKTIEIPTIPADAPSSAHSEATRKRAFEADKNFWPLVILTSNSEKELPDAFLRRCVFFHIDFPDSATLAKIVEKRVALAGSFPKRVKDVVKLFEEVRKLALRKKPATAELLRWTEMLFKKNLTPEDIRKLNPEALAVTYALLAKSQDDKDVIKNVIEAEARKWTQTPDKPA